MKKQKLHIIVWKEEELFVAKFLELELASQGKTKDEAIANLKEEKRKTKEKVRIMVKTNKKYGTGL